VSTILTIHKCLRCGVQLPRYDGWERAVPPFCWTCDRDDAPVHPGWAHLVAEADAA